MLSRRAPNRGPKLDQASAHEGSLIPDSSSFPRDRLVASLRYGATIKPACVLPAILWGRRSTICGDELKGRRRPSSEPARVRNGASGVPDGIGRIFGADSRHTTSRRPSPGRRDGMTGRDGPQVISVGDRYASYCRSARSVRSPDAECDSAHGRPHGRLPLLAPHYDSPGLGPVQVSTLPDS